MSGRDPIKKKEYNERYYSKNKDKIKKRLKEWYLENKEKRKERYKENSRMNYYKDKKKKMARVMAYQKIKNKTDINWILRKRLRGRLQKALKGIIKSKRTMELLGVPHLDFLKAWLQSQFKEGMTWENRHLWHIDHIIPCSSFDLTKPEEQAKCFHYTNLQPLWASENLSKGNRIS
jgi:hypothetical protein